ncbi:MAG: methyltransferase domain-containing protein [Bacteroidetes bacterium]|nr:methyltransferase domain-containing protein [Bacteroidota bacterium]
MFVALGVLSSGLVVGLWRRGGIPVGWTLGLAAGARLIAFVLPPSLSDDAYRYVWDGLVQHAGLNPYRYVPSEVALPALQASPLVDLLNSASYYSVYPPLSQMVFFLGGWAYAGDWQASYYVIKAVFVAVEWGGLLLLARMADRRMLLLYALQPLVIIEVAGQGHTEALMVGALLLALYMAHNRRPRWASAALGAATMAKLYPLVLFPLLMRRFGWRGVWPGMLVMVLLGAPFAAPHVVPHVVESLRLYTSLFEFNAGLYLGVKNILAGVTGEDWSKTLGPLLTGLYLAILPLLYVLDARRDWPLSRGMLVVLGAFLVFTTTVHPWYLLAVLPLLAVQRHVAWHWLWLAAAAFGTYLLYRPGGGVWYGAFVVVGWGGWAIFALWGHRDALLQRVQRWRARRKVDVLASWLPERPDRILDLGAGEGYVGRELASRTGADVQLLDVLPMNRTGLPHQVYDGKHVPFEDDTFDATVLYFVLHHCKDPAAVVQEALRVTDGPVLVVESVYTSARSLRVLTVLDRVANRLRSGGAMAAQEEHLHFRTAEQWRLFFSEHGAVVQEERQFGSVLHRQAAFVLVRQTEDASTASDVMRDA